MRAVLQRVTAAAVDVGGETFASIGIGLAVLLGIGHADGERQAQQMAEKIANMRIFSDTEGRFNRSALDVGAAVLLVSQFTLYADTRKGRRPSFVDAATPERAEPLVDRVAALIRATGLTVSCGRFGAHMLVRLTNDGPVTIVLDVP